ncbi:putative DEAD-box ATP-dependent RNA helicase 29-like, partial [Trifolium medium]|nr:putative DEAD-box ATP-dependent RNA helicase 29-like [Trifolium medium]
MFLAFVCLALALVLMICNMYRLDDAVLDLVADDGAGIKKQKSVYHWDKRSKKYIKLNNGDRVAANGK